MNRIWYTTWSLALIAAFVGIVAAQESEKKRPEGAGPGGPGGPGGFMRAIPVIAALDADEDGEISAKEIDNAVAALKGLDKDKDGKLTGEELRPEFARGGFGGGGFGGGGGGGGGFGGPGGRGGPPNPDETVTRWMEFDRNRDGKLGKDELSERMQSVLTRADADNDGFATKDELLQLAKREVGAGGRGPGAEGGFGGPGGPGGPGGFGPPRPEQFVERALEFDADKDGKLSKEELGKMAEQMGRMMFGGRGGEGGRRQPDRPDRPQRPPSEDK